MTIYLKISSWKDHGYVADHYYGYLESDDPNFQPIELLRDINGEEAIELDIDLDEQTQRFNSIKDLKVEAKKFLKKNYPKAKLIVDY